MLMPQTLILCLVWLAFGAVSYLLGSISFAVIFTKRFAHTDVREHGSGNAGMTNVFRTAGVRPGALTLAFDLLKGVAAALLGQFGLTAASVALMPPGTFGPVGPEGIYAAVFCGFCCVIGHIFPLWFSFRGGKGVLTSLGTILVFDWRVGVAIVLVFLLTLALSRRVSLSSILAAASFPVAAFFFSFFFMPLPDGVWLLFGWPVWLFRTLTALCFAAVVIAKHRANIGRLLRGEEKPFTIHKDKQDA